MREAVGFLIKKGVPYMAKKSVEMAKHYGSEALRNKNHQKKAIDYGLEKLTPSTQNVGSETLNQLSTKIRPNKRYKIDRECHVLLTRSVFCIILCHLT